jgi:hypothetical protein
VSANNLFNQIKWINAKKEIIELRRPLEDSDQLIVNLDMAGFYRVNYWDWEAKAKYLSQDHTV